MICCPICEGGGDTFSNLSNTDLQLLASYNLILT